MTLLVPVHRRFGGGEMQFATVSRPTSGPEIANPRREFVSESLIA